jgi:hypothetical protein
MRDSDWLDPFTERPQGVLAIPEPPMPVMPAWTPEERAESRARIRAKIAEVLAPMRRHQAKAAAASDPEAPLMALFAAHETAVVEAAAAARQSLAYRQVAWRQGMALDGQPVG